MIRLTKDWSFVSLPSILKKKKKNSFRFERSWTFDIDSYGEVYTLIPSHKIAIEKKDKHLKKFDELI